MIDDNSKIEFVPSWVLHEVLTAWRGCCIRINTCHRPSVSVCFALYSSSLIITEVRSSVSQLLPDSIAWSRRRELRSFSTRFWNTWSARSSHRSPSLLAAPTVSAIAVQGSWGHPIQRTYAFVLRRQTHAQLRYAPSCSRLLLLGKTLLGCACGISTFFPRLFSPIVFHMFSTL